METHRMFGSPSGKVVATLVVSPQDVIQPTRDHSFLTAAWMKIRIPRTISEHKAHPRFRKNSLKGWFFPQEYM